MQKFKNPKDKKSTSSNKQKTFLQYFNPQKKDNLWTCTLLHSDVEIQGHSVEQDSSGGKLTLSLQSHKAAMSFSRGKAVSSFHVHMFAATSHPSYRGVTTALDRSTLHVC